MSFFNHVFEIVPVFCVAQYAYIVAPVVLVFFVLSAQVFFCRRDDAEKVPKGFVVRGEECKRAVGVRGLFDYGVNLHGFVLLCFSLFGALSIAVFGAVVNSFIC